MNTMIEIPIWCEVLGFCQLQDILRFRMVCKTSDSFVRTDESIRSFWWVMIRRVAHLRRYAHDIDECYTLRRIGIFSSMKRCHSYARAPTFAIQQGRKLYGECINDRHLNSAIMTIAKEEGKTTHTLYKIWKTYAKKRIESRNRKQKRNVHTLTSLNRF